MSERVIWVNVNQSNPWQKICVFNWWFTLVYCLFKYCFMGNETPELLIPWNKLLLFILSVMNLLISRKHNTYQSDYSIKYKHEKQNQDVQPWLPVPTYPEAEIVVPPCSAVLLHCISGGGVAQVMVPADKHQWYRGVCSLQGRLQVSLLTFPEWCV